MKKRAIARDFIMLAAMASCLSAFPVKAEHGEADDTHPAGGRAPKYIMHKGDTLPNGATPANTPPDTDPNIKVPQNVADYQKDHPESDPTAEAVKQPVEGVDVPYSHDLGR